MYNKSLIIGLLITVVIAIGGYYFPQVQKALGVVGTRFPNGLAVGSTASVTQNKMTIGNSGTAIGNFLFGTCNLLGADMTQAASSTKSYDCAVTGATSASIVFAQLSTTTGEFALGNQLWDIVSAKGSTTADFITVRLFNGTNASTIPSAANVGSSTNYLIIR